MWIFPSEQAKLFDLPPVGNQVETGIDMNDEELNAGDGGDLIEVSARDLARRCLELVGEELGLQR